MPLTAQVSSGSADGSPPREEGLLILDATCPSGAPGAVNASLRTVIVTSVAESPPREEDLLSESRLPPREEVLHPRLEVPSR